MAKKKKKSGKAEEASKQVGEGREKMRVEREARREETQQQ